MPDVTGSDLRCPTCSGPVFIFSTKEIRCPECRVGWNGYGQPQPGAVCANHPNGCYGAAGGCSGVRTRPSEGRLYEASPMDVHISTMRRGLWGPLCSPLAWTVPLIGPDEWVYATCHRCRERRRNPDESAPGAHAVTPASVACPDCGARPGVACHSLAATRKVVYAKPHPSRRRVASEHPGSCHCGRPVHVYEDGFTRDMCEECSSVRCDVDGSCPVTSAPLGSS